MVLLKEWLNLPSSLLVLLMSECANIYGQELDWPYNLPSHVKYYPQDEVVVKRNIEIQERMQQQTPIGMRKMSGDPGEKFMMDYWQFGQQDEQETCRYGNATNLSELAAPLQRHGLRYHRPILPRFLGLKGFEKRAYECPADSYSCTSIGRPDSCCATGSSCQIVPDTGLGDVGCCAGNQVCGGSVATCPNRYTSCPQNPGGGCCLPGYACDGIGCIQVSTAVVIVTPTPSTTSTSTSSTPPPPSTSSTTTVVVDTTASTSSSASSVPPSTTSPPSSTSVPPSTLVCSSGFRSCPSSLGGGCCPTDRACARDFCPELSSTGTFAAPARPTSASTTSSRTSSTTASAPPPGCPTGFYACSAYYGGGCCQTGRNCDVTSCPAGGSITVVDGSTLSIVAPTGSGVSSAQTLLTGNCANGWSTCAREVGGGCCPTGYACGMQCTATVSNAYNATVGKIAPNEGSVRRQDSLLALIVMGFVVFGIFV